MNDGSNDNTEQIILDMRKTFLYIKYFNNGVNKGVTFSKNQAHREAKGEFIIDMDDDDIVSLEATG